MSRRKAKARPANSRVEARDSQEHSVPRPGSKPTPWNRPWYLIWLALSCAFEVLLIYLSKEGVISLPLVQLIVAGICVPIVAHMIVSAIRTLLMPDAKPRRQ